MLIQIWKANRTHDLIAASRAFAVHPLAAEHADLVRQLGFRSGHDGAGKLDGLAWTPGVTGSPILADAARLPRMPGRRHARRDRYDASSSAR